MAQPGYQVCQVTDSEWRCREFKPVADAIGEDALRRALVTLGGEGWELVTAIDHSAGVSSTLGITYLLKRQR